MLLLYQPVSEFPNKCNPDWVEKWILKKCLSLLCKNFHWNSRWIFQVDLTWFNKKCWISHRKQLQTYSKSWDQFSVLVGAANDSREAPRFKLPVSSSTLKCFCTIIWVTWMLKACECLQKFSFWSLVSNLSLDIKCDFETQEIVKFICNCVLKAWIFLWNLSDSSFG